MCRLSTTRCRTRRMLYCRRRWRSSSRGAPSPLPRGAELNQRSTGRRWARSWRSGGCLGQPQPSMRYGSRPPWHLLQLNAFWLLLTAAEDRPRIEREGFFSKTKIHPSLHISPGAAAAAGASSLHRKLARPHTLAPPAAAPTPAGRSTPRSRSQPAPQATEVSSGGAWRSGELTSRICWYQ